MTTRPGLVILGSGRFAEDVADIVSQEGAFEVVAFVEGVRRERCAETLRQRPIVWVDDLPARADVRLAVCAVGSTRRGALIRVVEAMGFGFVSVRHPDAVVSPASALGDGCILGPGVVIASSCTLGRHVIVNRGVLIGHHTTIGDGVTIGPGANLAGSVTVGPETYVGMGAVILEHLTVGAGVVVGAGSVVFKDVPDRVKVLGSPARILEKDVDRL